MKRLLTKKMARLSMDYRELRFFKGSHRHEKRRLKRCYIRELRRGGSDVLRQEA